MSSIDQTFVEFIVKSLVGKPDNVHIERRIDEKGVLLELSVDPEDLGRVIGKRGATAQSIRTLLRALGTKNEARYNLKIIDTAEQDEDGPATTPEASTKDSDSRPADLDESENSVAETDASSDVTTEDVDGAKDSADEDEESNRLKKAKQELADLDDLDI